MLDTVQLQVSSGRDSLKDKETLLLDHTQ
jgi:hypothetical protein